VLWLLGPGRPGVRTECGAEAMQSAVGDLFSSVVLLILLVMLAAVALYLAVRVRMWLQQDQADEPDLLEQFRDLYLKGELTKEEFRRVQERLGKR